MAIYPTSYVTDLKPSRLVNPSLKVSAHPGQFNNHSRNNWYSLLEQDLLLIHELVNAYGPFSPNNAMVGVCEDGLPFMLDLNNADIGSILVTGEPGCGKTALLKFILASASLLNSPEQVMFQVVTPEPREYHPFSHNPHCNRIYQSRKAETTCLIDSLLQLADRRQHHPGEGATQLLVIDDLPDFIHGLDNETYWGFEWLVRYGTRRRIWVIASQSTAAMNWLDSELLESFQTRVWGGRSEPGHPLEGMNEHLLNSGASGSPDSEAAFHVPYNESWLKISTSKVSPGKYCQ
jgi:hypothetical protein